MLMICILFFFLLSSSSATVARMRTYLSHCIILSNILHSILDLTHRIDKDATEELTTEISTILNGMDLDPELDVNGKPFNLKLYQKAFKTICPDYGDAITNHSSSVAMDFCLNIINGVDPEIDHRDIVLNFLDPTSGCVSIVPYKKGKKIPTPVEGSMKLVLTDKQANLIAMDTFCKFVEFSSNFQLSNELLLPEAAKYYNIDAIVHIARELKLTVCEVLHSVNCSAQAGGHYTEHASLNCALVIATIATRSMKNENARNRLIRKVFRRYQAVNKSYEKSVLNVYAKYASCTEDDS